MSAMEHTIADFLNQHTDDTDTIKNAEKRIAYGQYWCKEGKWKFIFGNADKNVCHLLFTQSYSW